MERDQTNAIAWQKISADRYADAIKHRDMGFHGYARTMLINAARASRLARHYMGLEE